jgi:hypothetical protein
MLCATLTSLTAHDSDFMVFATMFNEQESDKDVSYQLKISAHVGFSGVTRQYRIVDG